MEHMSLYIIFFFQCTANEGEWRAKGTKEETWNRQRVKNPTGTFNKVVCY